MTDKREKVAEQIYIWVHPSASPGFHSKKTPEVVRVGYRKRADQIIAILR